MLKYGWLQIHNDKYTEDYWYYESPRKKFHLMAIEIGTSEDDSDAFIAQERLGIKSVCGRKLKYTTDLMLARHSNNVPANHQCKRCRELIENQSKELHVSMSAVKM